MILISRLVQDPPYIREAKPGRFDAIGLGLLALWIGLLQIVLDKGQEDDWFSAGWIRWATAIVIIALVAFIWREIRNRRPLVDFQSFRDRNFAIGCVQIFLFGGVVYGMVTLLPLFFQTVLGYTALTAGWAVAPRGIGAIFAMPLVGILMTRVDSRRLIMLGFAGVAVCNLWLGHATLYIGQWTLFWAITLSGFFLGFVFVPLATVAMGTLADYQISNASGIYNLFRNIGGSVGISAVETVIARHEQVHRNQLVHYFALQNPVFDRALAQLRALMTLHSSSVDALHQALRVLQNSLKQQAALWSYVDDFRYLAVVCFLTIPVGFALKRISRARRVAAH